MNFQPNLKASSNLGRLCDVRSNGFLFVDASRERKMKTNYLYMCANKTCKLEIPMTVKVNL